jgi:DsbC/DsbD-like thiol-disulfide interchange protein
MRTTVFIVLLSSAVLAQSAPNLSFRGDQQSKHATITAAPTDASGAPGAKVSLFVDITPKPGIHVYAPGSADYIPVSVKLEPAATVKAGKLTYPKADTMMFANEKVSVFQKPFRLTQDVTLEKSVKAGDTVNVAGTVQIQACDDKVCFPPENIPIKWSVAVK